MRIPLYRCKECTLLRVQREGETCEECTTNLPQTLGNSTGWLINPARAHVAPSPKAGKPAVPSLVRVG
jgi:hypothetical protein